MPCLVYHFFKYLPTICLYDSTILAPYICFYRVWPNLTIPPIWFYYFNFHPPIYSPSPNLLPEFSNSPKLTTGIQGRLVKNFFKSSQIMGKGWQSLFKGFFQKTAVEVLKEVKQMTRSLLKMALLFVPTVQCLGCHVRWSNCDWWWFGDPNDRCQLDLLWKKPGLSVLTRINNYFQYFHRTKKSLN